jgi:hypothetical protein
MSLMRKKNARTISLLACLCALGSAMPCGYCGGAGVVVRSNLGGFCCEEHRHAKELASQRSLASRPKGWNKPQKLFGVKIAAPQYKWDPVSKEFHPPDLSANFVVASGCHIPCCACFKIMSAGDNMWAFTNNTLSKGYSRPSCSFLCRKYYTHMHDKFGMDGSWIYEADTGIGASRAINSLVIATLTAYRDHGVSYVNDLYERTRNSVRVHRHHRKGKKLFKKIGRV